MKYYIIAGEPSGDLHASNLMKALKAEDADAQFRYWGGDLMAQQGGTLVRHYRDTAVMGVWDVLTHLGKISNNIKLCRADLLAHRPDVLILVDYAGFNLPMAKFAKKNGIKTFYYIVPKTWASKEGRNKQLKTYVDKLFTILPFETQYFESKGISVCYCGNPVMDAIENRANKDETFVEFCQRNNLDNRPKVALLAGSRQAELKYNLPVMLQVVDKYPDYQFVIAGAPSFTITDYEPYLNGRNDVKILFNQTYQLVSQARAALVTSGTATLETAVLNCPQVVVYLMWGGAFSNFVAHLFIKSKFISLVNLILGRETVKELFQKAYTFEKLTSELSALLAESQTRQQMLSDYAELRQLLGGAGCSERAAQGIYKELKN